MKTQLQAINFILIVVLSCYFQFVNAQIIYTDVNPDFTGSTNGAAYLLDLNNDGITDFTISMLQSTYGSCGNFGSATSTTINIVSANSNAVLVDTIALYPEALSVNQNIDSLGLWLSGSLLLTSRIPSCVHNPILNFWYWVFDNTGRWNNRTNKFLGLRLVADGNNYYGWAKLDIYNQGDSASFFTVKEYAYNGTPDQSLLTGQYDCTAPTVSATADGPLTYCSWDSIAVVLTATSAASQYQWLKDGVEISGATDSTYLAKTVGNFKVQVNDICSSVISQGVTIDKVTFTNSVSVNGGTLSADVAQSTYQWLDCATMQPIEGAIDKSFTPSQSGSYSVQITFDGCTDTSDCYEVSITGISEINFLNSISIVPNPLSASTTISFSLPQTQIVSFKIYDLDGRLIRTLANEVMPIGTHELLWNAHDENRNMVSAGIYFLQIQSSGFSKMQKLIVTH